MSIKVRLMGLPNEVEAALAALPIAFEVLEVSERNYANRGGRNNSPSKLVRAYAEVAMKDFSDLPVEQE